MMRHEERDVLSKDKKNKIILRSLKCCERHNCLDSETKTLLDQIRNYLKLDHQIFNSYLIDAEMAEYIR